MTTTNENPSPPKTTPELPAAIRERLKAQTTAIDTAGQPPRAEITAAPAKRRLYEFLARARRSGTTLAPMAGQMARRVRLRFSPRASAAGSPDSSPNRTRRPQREMAGRVVAAARATGVRIGSTLDAIVTRMPANRTASRTPVDAVPTFDATPPELKDSRPSLFAAGMLATACVTAGLIHLATTFAIPVIGLGSAYATLKPALPANRMVAFPVQTPGRQILPFASPDTLYAICRFDITASPVVVRALLPGVGWSLTLYTPAGDNFYAMPGTVQGPTDVAFMVVPPTDRILTMMPGARREEMKLNQVVAPSREGLAVVRAPIKSAALIEETRRELAASSCKPSELAAPVR